MQPYRMLSRTHVKEGVEANPESISAGLFRETRAQEPSTLLSTAFHNMIKEGRRKG